MWYIKQCYNGQYGPYKVVRYFKDKERAVEFIKENEKCEDFIYEVNALFDPNTGNTYELKRIRDENE
jgi:hypothetical protein